MFSEQINRKSGWCLLPTGNRLPQDAACLLICVDVVPIRRIDIGEPDSPYHMQNKPKRFNEKSSHKQLALRYSLKISINQYQYHSFRKEIRNKIKKKEFCRIMIVYFREALIQSARFGVRRSEFIQDFPWNAHGTITVIHNIQIGYRIKHLARQNSE